MFHMTNKLGNAHRMVNSERERDRLIELGYIVVEEPKKTAKKTEKKAVDHHDGT